MATYVLIHGGGDVASSWDLVAADLRGRGHGVVAVDLPCEDESAGRYLLCRDDRVFPAEWTRRVVRERLGITPDEIDGGHCPFLSRPKELTDRLEAYQASGQNPKTRRER